MNKILVAFFSLFFLVNMSMPRAGCDDLQPKNPVIKEQLKREEMESPKKDSPPVSKVTNIENIKQGLLGLDKKVKAGRLVKVKVEDLPKDTAGIVTAIYKWALLENGKGAPNSCEILTKRQKNTDDRVTESDFIFSCQDARIKYQVLFSVVYIETKKDNPNEILSVFNGPMLMYDIQVEGYVPPPDPPSPDVVPDSKFGLIRIAYSAIGKVNLPKDKLGQVAMALSSSHATMASKIAAGVITDIKSFLEDSKVSNNDAVRKIGVDPTTLDGTLDKDVQNAFEKLWTDGKVKTLQDLQIAWSELAEGFRLASVNVGK
jgi:SepF-like predicted cell division protein (DUF552 family)